jgi:D-alanyl-D-alanine carboxypeptidase
MTGLLLSGAFSMALIIGSGCRDPGTEPVTWNTPQIEAGLAAALQGWVEDFGLYGGAMRVYSPGRLEWSGATGLLDAEAAVPYAADSLGRVASSTKPFTAALVLQLIDQGLLTFDTTLDGFLPGMPDFPYAADITVEHLLRHRSGIRDVQIVDLFYVLQVLLDPHRWWTPEDILSWTYGPFPILSVRTLEFLPREPVGAPGDEYHYSQPGYCALGMIVEQVTGRTLADAYDERIIEPLGLAGTHLPRLDDPVDPPGYTNLFGLLDEKIPNSDLISSGNAYVSTAYAAGGIVSTARELVTFLEALLGGELYSAEALALVQDWMPHDSATSGDSGYGLGLYRGLHDGYTTIGHDGGMPGGQAKMQYIEELDTYIGAVTNTDPDRVEEPGLVERVWTVLKAAE